MLLVGQFWSTAISYCSWLLDLDKETIELCSCDDADSGEDNKKEKEDKFRIGLYFPKFEISMSTIRVLHSEDFQSIHHPEITTPPPEFFLS